MHDFWDYAGATAVVLFGVGRLFIGFGLLRQTIERAVLRLRTREHDHAAAQLR
ncbi:hypothetical protein [Nocardia sp. NPDC057227]|uniref:hypothetical protein n=1 Tax=Nocardia sp. NPDC057227 TaxID=3346056 RepID=UPI0036424B68